VRAPRRSARRGYLLAAAGAALFAGNGATARVLLDDGLPATRLAWLRSAVVFIVILAWVLARDRSRLRVRRAHVPRLALLGLSLAVVQASYFVGIDRLGVGPALTIQYLGPLLILVWLTVAWRRNVPRGMWGAAALALLGCLLVVRGWAPQDLDAVGVAAALVSAVTFAAYAIGTERSGRSYAAETTLLWGFGFAALLWTVAVPPWSFPWGEIAAAGHLGSAAYVCLAGTLLGFALEISAVRHIPASRVVIIATIEPVLGSAIAWIALGEALGPVQILGGLLVVGAVAWVQLQRAAGPEEELPAWPAPGPRARPPGAPLPPGPVE